jgi:hypothetical protein
MTREFGEKFPANKKIILRKIAKPCFERAAAFATRDDPHRIRSRAESKSNTSGSTAEAPLAGIFARNGCRDRVKLEINKA